MDGKIVAVGGFHRDGGADHHHGGVWVDGHNGCLHYAVLQNTQPLHAVGQKGGVQLFRPLDDLIGKQRGKFMHCHCKSSPFRNTEICEEMVSAESNAARCVPSGKISVSCLRRSLYRHIFQKRNSGILFFYKKLYITTKKFVQTHKLRS